ncbi:MAG TPA: cob(I)yrinic acid a,c-diamide adenosyltransferase [Actinomycetota bacterium]|nr:cob(I)yrinic acid a,c-diamide adenosyltransferase [Actinomycetota bacterium]
MTGEPPTAAPETASLGHARSLVLVHTGDGKGKSTAAMGVALRARARGWRVLVVQFVKSGDWRAGEQEMLQRLGADWLAAGDGFSWDSDDLEASAGLARQAWAAARAALAGGTHELVVLDEVTYPMTWGWIDTHDVVATIAGRDERVSVVATGRDAPPALVEVADTATEMRNLKHAFEAGLLAKRGIDF